MEGNWKTTPTPPGNLDPWATTELGFSEFFSTTVPGISSWLNIVFIYHPDRFLWKGGFTNDINLAQSTAFMLFLIHLLYAVIS